MNITLNLVSMATPYNRLKKHRQLKRLTENTALSSSSTHVELDNSEDVALDVDDIMEYSCNQNFGNINCNVFFDHSYPRNPADINE